MPQRKEGWECFFFFFLHSRIFLIGLDVCNTNTDVYVVAYVWIYLWRLKLIPGALTRVERSQLFRKRTSRRLVLFFFIYSFCLALSSTRDPPQYSITRGAISLFFLFEPFFFVYYCYCYWIYVVPFSLRCGLNGLVLHLRGCRMFSFNITFSWKIKNEIIFF